MQINLRQNQLISEAHKVYLLCLVTNRVKILTFLHTDLQEPGLDHLNLSPMSSRVRCVQMAVAKLRSSEGGLLSGRLVPLSEHFDAEKGHLGVLSAHQELGLPEMSQIKMFFLGMSLNENTFSFHTGHVRRHYV